MKKTETRKMSSINKDKTMRMRIRIIINLIKFEEPMKTENRNMEQILTAGDVDGGAIKHPIVNLKILTVTKRRENHSTSLLKGLNG
jgi:hypothetical protein